MLINWLQSKSNWKNLSEKIKVKISIKKLKEHLKQNGYPNKMKGEKKRKKTYQVVIVRWDVCIDSWNEWLKLFKHDLFL